MFKRAAHQRQEVATQVTGKYVGFAFILLISGCVDVV